MTVDGVYLPCPTDPTRVVMDNHPRVTLVNKIKDCFSCNDAQEEEKKKQTNHDVDGFGFRRFLGVTFLSSIFLVSLAGTGIMWFTDLYVEEIINQMTIRPGSDVYDAWKTPPVQPMICIYVFNYTNLPEYIAKIDKKIKLKEVGPYCYRETLEKRNVTFNDDGTVTYADTRSHEYEPYYSRGDPEDILVVPNLPLISTVAMTKDLNFFAKVSMSYFLNNVLNYSEAVISVKAHDLFFGYDDKLIKLGVRLSEMFNFEMPATKFGLLASRAAITDDTTTVRTGTNDVDRIGIVTKINGREILDAWSDDECNRIDGSDGAFFPRHNLNSSATVYLFHKDLCRRVPFTFLREVDFQEGIIAMRFQIDPKVYVTNGTCFCPAEGCAPDGVFDVSPCHMGAPIMISYPHLMHADPKVTEPFEGLEPDPSKHNFFLDVQRLLGFTLGTISRLQLNVRVHKPKGMTVLKHFPEGIILPVSWIQVSAEKMPPDLYNMIYHATFTVRRMQLGLMWGSLILSLITGWLLYRYIRNTVRVKTSHTPVPQSPVQSKEAQEILKNVPNFKELDAANESNV